MDVTGFKIDQAEASRLYKQYRDHRHSATPLDDDIRRIYREISKGKVVIRALESIRAAGLGVDRLPRLAIVRADAPSVFMSTNANGSAAMAMDRGILFSSRVAASKRFRFDPGTFPGIASDRFRHQAATPHIPPHLRPRTALDNYHILFEAEWSMIPPVDPYLLRRIGESDAWLVLGAWDLTDVERAAMAQRIRPV